MDRIEEGPFLKLYQGVGRNCQFESEITVGFQGAAGRNRVEKYREGATQSQQGQSSVTTGAKFGDIEGQGCGISRFDVLVCFFSLIDMMGDDEVVVSELRGERSDSLLVGFALVLVVEVFLEFGAARDKTDGLVGKGFPFEEELDLDGFLGSHGHNGIFEGDEFEGVAENLVEAGLILADFVEEGTGDEEGFGALEGPGGLTVIDDLIDGVFDDVHALRGGGVPGAVEAFLGGVAEIDEVGLEVVGFPLRGMENEFCAFEIDFTREPEIAMVVAVISEAEIDVDIVSDADELGVDLHPGVVCRE